MKRVGTDFKIMYLIALKVLRQDTVILSVPELQDCVACPA
jgi:hypothetical protein